MNAIENRGLKVSSCMSVVSVMLLLHAKSDVVDETSSSSDSRQ